jgi:hypothetical protein
MNPCAPEASNNFYWKFGVMKLVSEKENQFCNNVLTKNIRNKIRFSMFDFPKVYPWANYVIDKSITYVFITLSTYILTY